MDVCFFIHIRNLYKMDEKILNWMGTAQNFFLCCPITLPCNRLNHYQSHQHDRPAHRIHPVAGCVSPSIKNALDGFSDGAATAMRVDASGDAPTPSRFSVSTPLAAPRWPATRSSKMLGSSNVLNSRYQHHMQVKTCYVEKNLP